jgi:myo-inositol catabolism protein IolC
MATTEALVKLGYDQSLFLVAFDHRSSFSLGLFGASEPLAPDVLAKIADAKALIFEAFERAIERGAPPTVCGILVDEQFGAEVARKAKARRILLAMPVERSGQLEFQFEYGADFGLHIEAFDPDFCKVLVRYNPQGDRALNLRQTERLARLSEWLHARGRRFLFELLVPATPSQLERCGGRERFDRELRPGLVVETLRELQAGGVEPDIWKVEGLETETDCERVVVQARSGIGREQVGCIVLGRGASLERVLGWLATAAAVRGFDGFAIGRTLWKEALERYVAGKEPREQARDAIAERYLRALTTYRESTRTDSREDAHQADRSAGERGATVFGDSARQP